MKRLGMVGLSSVVIFGAAVAAGGANAQMLVRYPATRADSTADTYFGTRIRDPYRWLEDQNSPEVSRWVHEQNAVTFGYLAKLPLREAFRADLTKLINVPKVGVPTRVAGRLYCGRNTGPANPCGVCAEKKAGGGPRVRLEHAA